MAKSKSDTVIQRRRLSPSHVRELSAYYEKGGTNYWTYAPKPKGIYFSASTFEQEEGSAVRTYTIQPGGETPGDGYMCVFEIDRYRPKLLRELSERIEAHAEAIHALCDGGTPSDMTRLRAILDGSFVPPVREPAE